MKFKNFSIIFLMLSLLLAGCAVSSNSKADIDFTQQNFDSVAQDTVTHLFLLYKNFDPVSFSQALSRDILPDKQQFISDVAASVQQQKVEQIKFLKDYIAAKVNVMSITVKWEKTYTVTATGAIFTAKGKSELIFRRYNGDWLLNAVNGDSPFSTEHN
ncbi:MAG: hypothetical protein HQL26_01080 [Candidatus Omnitrophica bacterium]|nr:hypothetical protein [Candidatus Omnitrophota bacterium]